MRHTYLYSMISALIVLLLSACNNAEYKTRDNSLYFTDAAGTSKASTITMEAGASINIAVRLAQKATEDVEVELTFNPELLANYNTQNGTEYVSLSNDVFPKNVTVTIPAGQISGGYNLHIDDFETAGVNYAVPVQLGKVIKGSISKSETQSIYIYLLSQPLITSVPVMRGSKNAPGAIKAAPHEDWHLQLSQWTIECWVRMNNFTVANQCFLRVGDGKNFTLFARYGDANSPYNYLQTTMFGANGGYVETQKDLKKDEWYHWAFAWDGTTLIIYRNGEKDLTLTPTQSGVDFNSFFMVLGGVVNDCSMSQVRFWNVNRSQDEIKNNMYNRVNPSNPKLIAYWPFDKAENNIFKDITGNGHDATIPEGMIKRWQYNVRFDK